MIRVYLQGSSYSIYSMSTIFLGFPVWVPLSSGPFRLEVCQAFLNVVGSLLGLGRETYDFIGLNVKSNPINPKPRAYRVSSKV